MKKLTLLLMLVVFALSGWAQTLLTQNFSGTFPPTGWTKEDLYQAQWTQGNSANAGGTAPELHFAYITGNGTSRFVSPAIDLTGKSTVLLSFKHKVDHYSAGYTVGVATRTGTTGAWTVVWSMAGANVTEVRNVVISNSNTNLAGFQFCFYITGNTYNINDWFIDDVSLIAPAALDAKMASTNIGQYIGPGNVTLTGKIENVGIAALTSFNVCWKVDNGSVNTTAVTGQNIALGSSYNYSCTQQWNATTGAHVFKVWVESPNGGTDLNHLNDTITSNVFVATQTTTTRPLIEEFTSSTCAPCASFHTTAFYPWMNTHVGQYDLIKYQMNWPGSGDIYYTAEGGVRRTYYGLNAVPWLYIDGVNYPTTTGGLNAGFDAAQTRAAFMSIDIIPQYSGTTVYVPVTINPYITANGLKLHVVICEKTTTGNVGSNGETSFKHVMMKMLPDASGTTVNLVAGTPYTQTFTQNMSGTHVEEMSDLIAVVFVQDNSNKMILQSKELDVILQGINENSTNSVTIYPNPASDYVMINNAENATIQVYDVIGNKVLDINKISNEYKMDVTNLSQGSYLIKIMQNNQVITKRFNLVK